MYKKRYVFKSTSFKIIILNNYIINKGKQINY